MIHIGKSSIYGTFEIHHISSYHIQMLSPALLQKGLGGYIQKVIYPGQHAMSFFGRQDAVDTGLWPITATELRTKFKSRQALQEAQLKQRGGDGSGWTFPTKEGEGVLGTVIGKFDFFWMRCLFWKGRLLEFLLELCLRALDAFYKFC